MSYLASIAVKVSNNAKSFSLMRILEQSVFQAVVVMLISMILPTSTLPIAARKKGNIFGCSAWNCSSCGFSCIMLLGVIFKHIAAFRLPTFFSYFFVPARSTTMSAISPTSFMSETSCIRNFMSNSCSTASIKLICSRLSQSSISSAVVSS